MTGGLHARVEAITTGCTCCIECRRIMASLAIAEVEPRFEAFKGDDAAALAFVIGKNLTRRHLSESQRAMIAAKLANIQPGTFLGNQHVASANGQTHPVSQSEAAERLHVSTRSVASAKKVLNKGSPETIAAVESGKLAVSAAAAALDEPPKAEQVEAVAAAPKMHAKSAAATQATPDEELPIRFSPAQQKHVDAYKAKLDVAYRRFEKEARANIRKEEHDRERTRNIILALKDELK